MQNYKLKNYLMKNTEIKSKKWLRKAHYNKTQ